MARALIWAAVAGFLGFVLFSGLFYIAAPHGPDRGLFIVFALMASIPVAAVAAIFGVLQSIVEELHDVRREVQRLRRIEELARVAADRSVQFKAGNDREIR